MRKTKLKSISRVWRNLYALSVIGLVVWAFPVNATLKVDITSGQIEPLPIALPDFFGTSVKSQGLGRDITRVVAADLERAGLFRPIDSKAFIQGRGSRRVRPNFPAWLQINSQKYNFMME